MQVKLVNEIQVAQSDDADVAWCLTQGRPYTVLGIEADSYRLLHDDLRSEGNKPVYGSRWSRPDLRLEEENTARPYPDQYAPAPTVFPPELFEIVDSSEPDFWVCKFGEYGERYCYPAEWMRVGFFEDYFDRLPEAHTLFWNVYYKLYSEG